MCINFFVHTLLERGIHTYIATCFSRGEVRRAYAFRTRYTYVYSVLVLAVATPKCVVHTLLERGMHTHTYRACFRRSVYSRVYMHIYSVLVLGELRRAHAFRTRYSLHVWRAC